MGYIIKRAEVAIIKNEKHWLLLYGRRKVGKTFLLRDLCKFKNYHTVKKDLSVMYRDTTISVDDMVREIKKMLSAGQTVIVDEFQRLEEGVLEELTLLHPKGKLILSGSSLRVIKKIFEPQSPLLGFLSPFKISFISPSDALLGLHTRVTDERLIELSTFLREPWLIPSYDKENVVDFIYKLIMQSRQTITALVGEIFTEEEREFTKKYEAIIELIGSGVWSTRELTSLLYSRKFIPDPSPTHVIQYLKNLEEMELVEGIKLHKSKKRYYRLSSPLMNLYYYLESRYDISERAVSLEEIRPTLQKVINLEIQNFIADVFSELYEGRKEYFISSEREVDFVITVRNKPAIIGEVKWKKLDEKDMNKFKNNSEGLYGKRMLFCKSGVGTDTEVEIITPEKLLSLLKERKKAHVKKSLGGNA